MRKDTFLWEILVPTNYNNGKEVEVDHHKKWDNFVQKITRGLTILKKSKGIWINTRETTFEESMIPVRINCTKKDIEKIADFTATHYKQEAVMYYLVSSEVVIINYDQNFKRKT